MEGLYTAVLFGGSLLLLITGIPIWAGLVGMSILSLFLFDPFVLGHLPYVLYSSLDNFALLAIPLFILLSAPIAATRASSDLYSTLYKWLHKVPGGLGIASMIACGIFAALCGSSPATAAAIGGIAIPQMREKGYSPALASGLIAHAGTFGILIPPSVTMILYGIATETSIGKCFIAGIIPGILEIFLSCIWVGGVFFFGKYFTLKENSVYYIKESPVDEIFTWTDRFTSLFKIIPFILIIIGIMGALYGGWATPSEAGAVGAVLAFLCVIFIYRLLDPKKLWSVILKALNESGMILMIMAGALIFGYVSSDLYVTQYLSKSILALPLGTVGTLIIINLFLLILGLFIPPAAVMVMVAPLLLPVIEGLGFSSVWFAVIATVNLEIGLVTPPVGLNLYIVKSIAPDVRMATVLWGVFPFLMIEIGVIILVSIFPALATLLPNLMV